MELIVLEAQLPYGGKTYRKGQRFEATPDHARLLILIEAAAPAPGYEREDLAAESVAGSDRDASQYARRDFEPVVIVKRKRGRPRKIREDAAS